MYFGILITGFIASVFNHRAFAVLFTVILAVLAFLRYGIGADYFSYEFLYNRLQLSVMDEYKYGWDDQEIGFRLVGSFLKSIGLSFQQYLILIAAINIFYVSKLCKEYSNNPTLSLTLYFCFYYLTWTFGGIRQGVVLAVGVYYLLKAIENKKTVKFTLITVLLSTIHSTALVLLFLYFVSKIKFTRNKLIILSFISVLMSLLPMGLLIRKLTWLPFYNKFAWYLDPSGGLNIPDFQSAGRIAFLIVALFFYNYFSQQSVFNNKVINVYIISILIYFFLQFSELTAARISIYGKYLDILLLVNFLYLWKKSINKVIYSCGLLILCSAYLFKETEAIGKNFYSDDHYYFTPYVNIYNKEEYRFTSVYEKFTID